MKPITLKHRDVARLRTQSSKPERTPSENLRAAIVLQAVRDLHQTPSNVSHPAKRRWLEKKAREDQASAELYLTGLGYDPASIRERSKDARLYLRLA